MRMYKAESAFWTVEEVDIAWTWRTIINFSQKKNTSSIPHCFFCRPDGIVNENLALNFMNENA